MSLHHEGGNLCFDLACELHHPDTATIIQNRQEDTKRLDWLESNRREIGDGMDNVMMALPFWYHAKGLTLREAIDAMRKEV